MEDKLMAATVTVNCDSDQGLLGRYEQNNSFADNRILSKIGPGDELQLLNWHTKILRIWIIPTWYWDKSTNTYNYSVFHPYLDLASRVSDHLLVTTGSTTAIEVRDGLALSTLEEVIINGLKHYKQQYPKIRYIEASNEYEGYLSDSEYYEVYQVHYRAVNAVNSELELGNSNKLLLGGPVTFKFNSSKIPNFLTNFANDSSADKLLYFISYHQYLHNGGSDEPKQIVGERSHINQWLSDRGLNPNLPVLVTEIGNGRPEDTGLPTDEHALLTGAANASIMYWYQSEPNIVPLNWVVHNSIAGLEFRDQFKTMDGYLFPYGKVLQAMSLMKITWVSASSSQLNGNSIGVYGLASKDTSGVTVLIWNYQHTSSSAHNTNVNVNNLPSEFTGKNIKLRRFAIDRVHEESPTLPLIEETVLANSGSFTQTYLLQENELQLLELTPTSDGTDITFMELESLTPSTNGESYQTIYRTTNISIAFLGQL